jgi:hypothetical protein
MALEGPLGGYIGAHIGMLAINEYHTDAVLLLTLLANRPPSPSSVAAACGPKPSN